MGGVRPLETKDLPKLTDVHFAAFGDYGPTREEVDRGYQVKLPELLLADPDNAHASPSLVFEQDGDVVGFVLVNCRPVLFRGERLWCATTSHLGVLPDARASLAGIHLLRAATEGPQDLTYVDRSNAAGRQALKAAGFEQIPADSLRWEKMLRPGADLSRRVGNRLGRGAGLLAKVTERVETAGPDAVRKRTIADLPPLPKTLASEPLTIDTVMSAAPGFLVGVELHPDFSERDRLERQWDLLAKARANSTIVSRSVTNRKGDVVGWYIVDINHLGDADVVQLLATPAQQRAVMLAMLHELREREVVRVEGDLPLSMLYDAEMLGCRPTAADATTSVKTANTDVLEAFRRGAVWLSALEGEFLMDPPAAVPR